MSEKFVRLNLGSILISKREWARAKKICGYDRKAIRECIIGNGLSSFFDAIDTSDYCAHDIAATQICYRCEKESGRK